MKVLKIISLFFLFSFSNDSKEIAVTSLSENESIACVGFITLDSECIVIDPYNAFVEFSWFLIIDTNCDPITYLKLEIVQETYHCDYHGHHSEYFIDYNIYPDSYKLHHLTIRAKCFKWRIRTNNSNWSNWQEFTFNDC
jgi:hypothetical protein